MFHLLVRLISPGSCTRGGYNHTSHCMSETVGICKNIGDIKSLPHQSQFRSKNHNRLRQAGYGMNNRVLNSNQGSSRCASGLSLDLKP